MKGFTLIELIVVVAIVVMVSGSGMVYLNNFNQWQKLEGLREEIISKLRLAASLARNRQVPAGYAGAGLQYVEVAINSGKMVAGINGVGSTFFSVKVDDGWMKVTLPTVLYFWGGSGHLSHDVAGTMYSPGEVARVYVGIQSGVLGYYPVVVNSLGTVSQEPLVVGSAGPI